MTKIYILITLIGTCNISIAQSGRWEKTIGNPDSCCFTGCSVKQLASGSVYFLGSDNTKQYTELFLVKFTPQGDTIWSKNYGLAAQNTFAEYLGNTRSGNLVLVGVTQDPTTSALGYSLTETDTHGTVIWNKTYLNLEQNAAIEYIEQTTDKGFIACGFINQPDNKTNDYLVIKTDSVGTIEWEKNYGFAGNDASHMVHQTADGGYIVGGDSQEEGSANYDNYAIKLRPNGEIEWDLLVGDEYNNGNQATLITSDGDFLFSGEGSNAAGLNFDIVLLKISKDGKLKWCRNIGGSGTEAGFAVTENAAKEYLITGYATTGSIDNTYTVFLAKTDVEGTCLGVKYFEKPDLSIGYDLYPANDGGYFIAGLTGTMLYAIHTFDENYTDTFSTTTITTGIAQPTKQNTTIAVYPNPANNYISIASNLPTNSTYTLYNTLGSSVKKGTNSALGTITIDTSDVPAGIYLLTIFSDTQQVSTPIIIHHE